MAADGWTLSVAIENLFALYDQPDTRICDEYVDYCDFLFKEVAEFDVHHWRSVLDGFVPGGSVTDTCRPIKNGLSAGKARVWPRLLLDAPDTLQAEVEQFSKTSDVTESAIYSMIWGLTLGEHSGACDVTFGTTVSGRHHDYENVSSIAGCFAQALPSRLIFSPDETPRGLVKKAMQEQARLLEQQASRLSDIEEAVRLQKDACLFDTVLTFQNYPENAPCTCEFDISFFDYRQYSFGGRPPVELKIEPGANDMFVIEFDDEKVPDDIAHALGSRFVQVLSEILNCPDKQLSEFKILGNLFKNNNS